MRIQADGIIKPAPQFEDVLRSTGYVNRPIEDGKVRSMIPAIQDADQQRLWPIEFELLQTYLGIDLNRQVKLSKKEAVASVLPGVIGTLKESSNIDKMARQLETFIRCAEQKEWHLGDRKVRISLTGLVLHKAVDPI